MGLVRRLYFREDVFSAFIFYGSNFATLKFQKKIMQRGRLREYVYIFFAIGEEALIYVLAWANCVAYPFGMGNAKA